MLKKLFKLLKPLLLVVTGFVGTVYAPPELKSKLPSPETIKQTVNGLLPQALVGEKTTDSEQTAKASCNEKLIPVEQLFITAMDPADSKYAVNLGQYFKQANTTPITQKLASEGYKYQVINARNTDCVPLFVIAVGEVKSQTDAWTLTDKLRDNLKLDGVPLKLPAG